jgi:hypothetical protein
VIYILIIQTMRRSNYSRMLQQSDCPDRRHTKEEIQPDKHSGAQANDQYDRTLYCNLMVDILFV